MNQKIKFRRRQVKSNVTRVYFVGIFGPAPPIMDFEVPPSDNAIMRSDINASNKIPVWTGEDAL